MRPFLLAFVLCCSSAYAASSPESAVFEVPGGPGSGPIGSPHALVDAAGLWSIFGVASQLNEASPLWADGAVRGVVATVDWKDLAPAKPPCWPRCTLAQLSDPALYKWGVLETEMRAVRRLGARSFGLIVYHNVDAPAWLAGNQIEGPDMPCPRLGNGRTITDWRNYRPRNFVKPTYSPDFRPPAAIFDGQPKAGVYDGVVPVIGCVEGPLYMDGIVYDPWDADYLLAWRGMLNAAAAKVARARAPGGPLDETYASFVQVTLGRSGDARLVTRSTARARYTAFDGMTSIPSVPGRRSYYPDNYLTPNDLAEHEETHRLVLYLWQMFYGAFKVGTADEVFDRVMINPTEPSDRPWGGLDLLAHLFQTTPDALDNTAYKFASATQGDAMPLFDRDVARMAGTDKLFGGPEQRWLRGEWDEPANGAWLRPDPNSLDKDYVNDRLSQELYWGILQSLFSGVHLWQSSTLLQLQRLHSGNPAYGAQIKAAIEFLNTNAGYKSLGVSARGKPVAMAGQSSDFSGPFAYVAFRYAPDFEDSDLLPFVGGSPWQFRYPRMLGSEQRITARWATLVELTRSRGLNADLATLARTDIFSPATYANQMRTVSHTCFQCYSGDFTSFIEIADQSEWTPWWDVGPVHARQGKYAKAIKGKQARLNVDPRWLKPGGLFQVQVTYLSKTGDSFRVLYTDASGNRVALAPAVSGSDTGSGVWRTAGFSVPSLVAGGKDAIVLERLGGDPKFHMVYLMER